MKLTRRLALLLALLLALGLGGCSLLDSGEEPSGPGRESAEEEEPDPEYPVEAGGAELTGRPGKVVSLAPSLTEKLYDLGMDDRLVGVSDYCDYPSRVLSLPPCGTAQLPDVDGILERKAHLVVAEAPLPDEAAALLAEHDIPVAVLPHAETVDALLATYIDLARLLEGDVTGGRIGESVAGDFRRRLEYLNGILQPYTREAGRKSVLYLRLLDFTTATGDTFENDLMEWACLDNMAKVYTDWAYPADAARLPEGQAAFAEIDVIYMDEAFVTITDLEQSDFYKGLPATIQDRYLYISSLKLERQSMRAANQLAEMAAYAYPDAIPFGGFSFNDQYDEDIPEPPTEESDPYGGDDEARAEGDDMLNALEQMPGGSGE